MLAGVQGPLFHIAAGSHPVIYRRPGGHKIICTGVKFKSCFNVVKTHTSERNSHRWSPFTLDHHLPMVGAKSDA